MGVRRVVLLPLGWEDLPKAISVHGADPALRLREPTPGVLLEGDGGWLLLDTGFNTALINDPYLRQRFYPGVEYVPVLRGDGEPLMEALDEIGIPFDKIHAVALSHLHSDHAGGLKLFGAKVPVHVQRRELNYGLSNSSDAERNGIFRIDFDDPAIEWRLADGDQQIAPGVTAISTPGHTPGHQSFMVELDETVGGGGFVFAFDAADLTANIEDERAIGYFIDFTPEETIEPIRRLKSLAAQYRFRLIPEHDSHIWPDLQDELNAAR